MANQITLQKEVIKTRKSGIELLKIIAIVLIVISHCVQTIEENVVDFQVPTTDWQLLLMRILRFDGRIGNIIFVVCSSYFLINSKRAKKEKAITLLLDSQFISIGIFATYCAACIVLSMPLKLTVESFLTHIFPDLYSMVWFVPAYVILYLSHPYLNKIIFNINKKEHFSICAGLAFVYGIGGLIRGNPQYSELLGFFIIYFIVAYIKLYCEVWIKNTKANMISFFSFFVAFVGITIAKNYLSLKISFFKDYPNIDGLVSVILLPMVLSLFVVFLNLDIKSKIINYLSSCSLFVYCIHENYFVRTSIRPKYYSFMISHFGEEKLLFYLAILIVTLLICTFIAAIIYKNTFHKLTEKLALKIKMCMSKINDILLARLGSKT